MILGNFPQFAQTHQHWCFHPPPNVPLVHINWRCKLIHKPRLYTFCNIFPLTKHQLWTWNFLCMIRYYKIITSSWFLRLWTTNCGWEV
jgi:hypothetical protein